MNRSLIVVLASPLVLALACTHEGRRERGYERREQAYAAQPGERVVAGRIIDVTSRTVTIAEADGDQRTLFLDPRTSVTVNGRAADFDNLRPGDEVRAAFEGPDGHRVAVSIDTAGGDARWHDDAYGNSGRGRR